MLEILEKNYFMKKVVFLFVIGALLASCGDGSNEYNISGEIEGVSEGDAILQKVESSGPVVVDSAKIVDGTFSFSGNVEHPELHLVYVNDNQAPVPFFLESGEINISGNVENLQEANVQGSELNAKFKKFNEGVPANERSQELQQEFMAARQDGDQDKMQQLSEEYQSIMEEQQQYYRDFVFANSDNAVGAFLAMNMANSMEISELEELLVSFEKSIPGHPYVDEMEEMLEPMKKQQEALDVIEEGKTAPDFTLTDNDGNEVSLEDFQGKYVFLDFWASWCRPCREESPNLVKAYEQYGGDNFEIVGVSLDKTSEPWLKAVEDDNMTWTQLHDPEGTVANEYGVQSIPFTLLLDKEGVIIDKNLRGEALQNKLEEIL